LLSLENPFIWCGNLPFISILFKTPLDSPR
jgi:hypothetical protein